ncbi:glycoside hydrolase family 43 protein [Hypoxylon sp. FL1284]|nr:glycoside hydrolase family 43 protein [Hypoxylon sp. FL1284]
MLYILLKDVLTYATRALASILSLEGAAAMQYDNSTLTLTSISTPDPFVNLCRGRYYLTFTAGNRVEIWSSDSLADIEVSASRHVIWTPPPGTEHSADLWAPELHALEGRWYVYYAAAHAARGNRSHRMYVLGGPAASEDPCLGRWEFLGRVRGLPDRWAIDGTVFAVGGHLYLAYSGWPLDRDPNDHSDLVQQLMVAKLESPIAVAATTGGGDAPPVVVISRPEHPWEVTRDPNGVVHGINEGPQFLRSPDGAWQGLAYSCAGSWTRDYKMAVLRYLGGDPLRPDSWRKAREPLVQQTTTTTTTTRDGESPPLFGPGHGSFLQIPGAGNDEFVLAVYHATDAPTDGWENRRARAQLVAFTDDGPYMGQSFGGGAGGHAGITDQTSPSGNGPGGGGGLVKRIKHKIVQHARRGSRNEAEPPGQKSLRELLGPQRQAAAGL